MSSELVPFEIIELEAEEQFNLQMEQECRWEIEVEEQENLWANRNKIKKLRLSSSSISSWNKNMGGKLKLKSSTIWRWNRNMVGKLKLMSKQIQRRDKKCKLLQLKQWRLSWGRAIQLAEKATYSHNDYVVMGSIGKYQSSIAHAFLAEISDTWLR